jgi:signal peptidase I
VCVSPADEMRLVKRIVGVPGDTVELRRDVLFLNGVRQNYTPLPTAFTRDMGAVERGQAVFAQEMLGSRAHAVMVLPGTPALRDFGPVQVPAGRYFVMGDNRDNSNDSRFFGFVARREIIGEAMGVFVSANLDRGFQPRFRRFFTSLD